MYLPNHAAIHNVPILTGRNFIPKTQHVKEKTGMRGKELLLCEFYQAVILDVF